mmetsp:Transcript_1582/g.4452  ORF Transcript_1582/g.4452 Transcript_1582/m.4452 type:complete len:238 (-) Transcript_1582:794-1507(-)
MTWSSAASIRYASWGSAPLATTRGRACSRPCRPATRTCVPAATRATAASSSWGARGAWGRRRHQRRSLCGVLIPVFAPWSYPRIRRTPWATCSKWTWRASRNPWRWRRRATASSSRSKWTLRRPRAPSKTPCGPSAPKPRQRTRTLAAQAAVATCSTNLLGSSASRTLPRSWTRCLPDWTSSWRWPRWCPCSSRARWASPSTASSSTRPPQATPSVCSSSRTFSTPSSPDFSASATA